MFLLNYKKHRSAPASGNAPQRDSFPGKNTMAQDELLLLMLSITACASSADGKTHLTFQIWDVYHRPGMQAMCNAYTARNPDVVIEVQATSWSEYWTKLEASAESNTMPDIFRMHTNQLLYYADFGMLADVTDLYEDVESEYYEKHFSEISRSNASGTHYLLEFPAEIIAVQFTDVGCLIHSQVTAVVLLDIDYSLIDIEILGDCLFSDVLAAG